MHQEQQFGMPLVNSSIGTNNPHPGATGQRYYTIQRVNGNGGNGKGDGIPGPHKHALTESDRVKKNSVQRWCMKRDKEEKKTQVSSQRFFYCPPFHPCTANGVKIFLARIEQHVNFVVNCERSGPALISVGPSLLQPGVSELSSLLHNTNSYIIATLNSHI